MWINFIYVHSDIKNEKKIEHNRKHEIRLFQIKL